MVDVADYSDSFGAGTNCAAEQFGDCPIYLSVVLVVVSVKLTLNRNAEYRQNNKNSYYQYSCERDINPPVSLLMATCYET